MLIKRIQSVDYKNPLLLFLFSPFVAMLLSFKFAHQKWAKNVFWLFCIFFGYTMVITSNSDNDSVRYKDWFLSLSKANISSTNFVDVLYSGGEKEGDITYLDIIQPLTSFLVSRITDNYHYLFAVFAIIYGYFYSRNIWFLLERIQAKQSFVLSLFIVSFIFICPVWRINAFRFWTAAQIFLFGTIPYLFEGKKKNLIIASCSVLAHFTFVLPVGILFLYTIIGNKTNWIFIFFIATSFIQQANLTFVANATKSLPEVFQGKVKTYIDDDDSENSIEQENVTVDNRNWYINYFGLFQKIIVYLFLIIFYYRKDVFIHKNKVLKNLFCFSMLFYGFANIANELPQGVRFYTIGNWVVFFLIIYYVNHSGGEILPIIKKLNIFIVPILLILIIVSIRIGLDVAGVITIAGNPFLTPFSEYDFPLIDLIK